MCTIKYEIFSYNYTAKNWNSFNNLDKLFNTEGRLVVMGGEAWLRGNKHY